MKGMLNSFVTSHLNYDVLLSTENCKIVTQIAVLGGSAM